MPRRRTVALVACTGSALIAGGCSTSDPSTTPAGSTAPTSSSAARSSRTAAQAQSTTSDPTRSTPRTTPVTTAPAQRSQTAPASAAATTLPVDGATHGATQVITVVAPSRHSTKAVLQRWVRKDGSWRQVGSAIPANLGTDGMTRHASESKSATPIGSFTLTHAFGHDPDPGTRLPYVQTTPDDWWISQAGPLYNTRQRCSRQCDFTRGDPNEHLYYETPAYDYAVVIDYNTRNAPGGVRQGGGSAFFLHVSEGRPTAGCVSIPVQSLLHIMRWLDPTDRPRILIGTG